MSSVGWPLSSKAYFSISSLRDSCQTGGASKHFTFIHAYEQTRVRTNTTEKVRGTALRDTHRPAAWEFHYGLDSTPSFALQLTLVACACISVSLCAQPGQRVCGCFCSDDMSICLGESLCLILYTARDDTLGYVIVMFCFLNRLTAVTLPGLPG